jgi:predicted nucleic acid-binding protein
VTKRRVCCDARLRRLLAAECANILWNKVSRAELSVDEAGVIALALQGAAITPHPTRPYLPSATRIACELELAAYDSVCLALAEGLRAPLVTADLRLVNAIRADPAARFALLVVPLSEFSAG